MQSEGEYFRTDQVLGSLYVLACYETIHKNGFASLIFKSF